MKRLLLWFLHRLQERRTYIGLAWLLTVGGVSLRPDLWDQITLAGMALAGLLEVVFKEPRYAPTPVPDSPDPAAAVAEWGQRFERLRVSPNTESRPSEKTGTGFNDR